MPLKPPTLSPTALNLKYIISRICSAAYLPITSTYDTCISVLPTTCVLYQAAKDIRV